MTDPDPGPGRLVRDRVPVLMEESGRRARLRRLSPEQRRHALFDKLHEEADELAAARGREVIVELADLLEVIRALAVAEGLDWPDVEAAARQKSRERGAYDEGWFMPQE